MQNFAAVHHNYAGPQTPVTFEDMAREHRIRSRAGSSERVSPLPRTEVGTSRSQPDQVGPGDMGLVVKEKLPVKTNAGESPGGVV